jgi:hypothetical protein
MRRPERRFPDVLEPLAVISAQVWHCKYDSLVALGDLQNLETLVVATYPDESLEPIGRLEKLRYLSLLHFPRVSDLSPLAGCAELVTVSLATLPSWDTSGKIIQVESLEPLARLPRLEHLELFGVCPPDRRLAPLLSAPSLASLRVSKYPEAESGDFYDRTGVSADFNPKPAYASA